MGVKARVKSWIALLSVLQMVLLEWCDQLRLRELMRVEVRWWRMDGLQGLVKVQFGG